MFRAGGVLFDVDPPDALTEAERAAVARLGPASPGPSEEPFRIRLVDTPPWTSDDRTLFPRWEPAVQRWVDGKLLASHLSFTAEIEPLESRARLHRRETRAYPLEAVVRTAMMARLPLVGGLPLHAAGVIADGRGLAFFGVSGAGKTTLAETSPHPVLSDELVALGPGDPPRLVRSGFWGEGRGPERATGAPLAALVALDRGPSFDLERLGPSDAVRRLVSALPVPLAAPLWSRALAVAAGMVSRVPVYRMAWAPDEPPWDRLAAAALPPAARGAARGLSPRT
jgi:hypothetical protein